MTPKESYDPDLFDDEKDQKDVEELFNKAVKAPPGPVGTFQVQIADAVLERAQSSGRRQIHYELVILVGPSKEEVIHKYDGIDTEIGTRIAGQNLKRLGINIDALSLTILPAASVKLKGQKASITAKVKGDYYNVNFMKLLTTAPTASTRTPTSSPGARKF